jgi:hypothetical protein
LAGGGALTGDLKSVHELMISFVGHALAAQVCKNGDRQFDKQLKCCECDYLLMSQIK